MFDTEFDTPQGASREYTPRDYAVWLTGMFGVVLISACAFAFASWGNSRLALREQTTSGVITSVGSSLRSGPTYRYRFSIDGRAYESGGSGEDFEAGKIVTIYFDPNDPFTSSLDDFRLLGQWKRSYAHFLFYVSIALGIVLFFVVRGLPSTSTTDCDR